VNGVRYDIISMLGKRATVVTSRFVDTWPTRSGVVVCEVTLNSKGSVETFTTQPGLLRNLLIP
jgi:hypothetical protein